MRIRPAMEADHEAIWAIFHQVVQARDSFAFDPDISREVALRFWAGLGTHTYVAENSDGRIVGSYYLKPNQPGLGDHVANAGYMVEPAARSQGIARAMGEHSLDEGRRLGYLAIQFNFVVATNHAAIHLWQQLGFRILGTVPGAFRHGQLGQVDVHIMFRALTEAA